MKTFIKKLIKFFIRNITGPFWGDSYIISMKPYSRKFGADRGLPIDRFFIQEFLKSNANFITGRVAEIGDDFYTIHYGKNIDCSIVLAGSGIKADSSYACDLTNPESYSFHNSFNCIICTNVLKFILYHDSAIKGLARLTDKNNGICLVTVAGLCNISRYDHERWGDYWRFTDLSIKLLFEKYFETVEIGTYGNAPVAASFILGLSYEDLSKELFNKNDPDYQVIITVIASNPNV